MYAVSSSKKVAEKVAEKLKQTEIIVKVEKANIMSKDIIGKYGILVSPAIAINGIVKFMGRVPSEAEVEKTIARWKVVLTYMIIAWAGSVVFGLLYGMLSGSL